MANTVTVKGVPALRARFEALGAHPTLMRNLALAAVREQKLLVPRKTGNLGRTIRIGSVTPTSAETVASANYAAYVERGTRPHIIKPKNKKVLAWKGGGKGSIGGYGTGSLDRLSAGRSASIVGVSAGAARPKAGGLRFAKRVRHPGTKAQPFMVPGAKKAVEQGGLKDVIYATWNDAA